LYYPYLRGKQYELLALKELAELLGRQQKVHPIIEPVRAPSGSGLERCLSALQERRVPFTLIVNPSVGVIKDDHISSLTAAFVEQIDESTEWGLGLLVDDKTNVEQLFRSYAGSFDGTRRLAFVHKGLVLDTDALQAGAERFDVETHVVDDHVRVRQLANVIGSAQRVSLRDIFLREARNADYLTRPPSVFTDEHLYFERDGWQGFGDYVTVGENFAAGGFQPRAVVIHWTYEREAGGPVMIRHFTSTSNADTANVAGKFLEAVSKLVSFLDLHEINTAASLVMREHFEKSTYPGLGVVKKLSIKNHLELMSEILAR
jgi:hypothetical protein